MLTLLHRSGQGKVYQLINRRRFQQMEVKNKNFCDRTNHIFCYRCLRVRTSLWRSVGRRTECASTTSPGWRARFSSENLLYFSSRFNLFISQDGERDRETSWVDQRGRPQLCGPLQDCQVREDQVPRYWWASSPTICVSVIGIFFTVMSDLLLNACHS